MEVKAGQIWVSTYMDNWFVRVKEFYKHNGRVEYIDDDGEVSSAHVTNFIDEFEFVRNKESVARSDAINHPEHYISHPSGIECIEVTRHMSFAAGNIIKYLWRNGLKDGEPSLKDLKKAAWYLNDMIDQLETNGE